jgi:hypothetical protein
MRIIDTILSRVPYLRYAYWYRQNCNYRPGHFYSPVVDRGNLFKRNEQIWRKRELVGIDMNEMMQEKFMKSLKSVMPFPDQKRQVFRFYFDNKTYGYADSLVLFSMMLYARPKRIIEVGCGFSSALMIDTSMRFFDDKIWFTLIEPHPEISLSKLLRTEDWLYVIQNIVQKVDKEIFSTLQEDDILFIDCSHVSKTGSDVNYLLTEVLPSLNKGVLVHIHDIFYPFEYPPEWVLDLRLNWNEIYSVHNFLLFNDAFEIVFFSDYMQQKYKDGPALFYKDRPGSLWLRKTR